MKKEINLDQNSINLNVSKKELLYRERMITKPKMEVSGYLKKYMQQVGLLQLEHLP